MADGFEFGSPRERHATMFLQHVAGFEVAGVDGSTVFVTPTDLEKDADAIPTTLRAVLDGEHGEVAGLSNEYLLRNLIIPNLPIGLYGDEAADPVILAASIVVQERGDTGEPLDYLREQQHGVSVNLVPTLGRLASVSCIREPRLGISNIDWLSADRKSCAVSLFGGTIQANISYDQQAQN